MARLILFVCHLSGLAIFCCLISSVLEISISRFFLFFIPLGVGQRWRVRFGRRVNLISVTAPLLETEGISLCSQFSLKRCANLHSNVFCQLKERVFFFTVLPSQEIVNTPVCYSNKGICALLTQLSAGTTKRQCVHFPETAHIQQLSFQADWKVF